MKKYLLGILVLVIAEAVALAVAVSFADSSNGRGGISEISDGERTYEVVDSTSYDTGEPVYYSCLFNHKTGKVVKAGVKKYNYEDDMKINAEGEDYVLLVYDGHYNVYDKQGKAVFKEDREFHSDYNHETIVINNGTLIADYNTGEYFDLKGNPVSSLSTKMDYLKHQHGDLVNIVVFAALMLVAFLLWYFLFWRMYMRKQSLTKAVRNTHSVVMLLFSLAAAAFVAVVVCYAFDRGYPVANNFAYKVVDSVDGYGGKVLLYYDKSTNSNDVVREGSSDMEEGPFPAAEYIIIKDGSKSNVYGPEGKAVFDEDLGDAELAFNRDEDIIFDRKSGKCYDMNGKVVDNLKTTIYKNESTVRLATVVVFMLLATLLWLLLSWKRRDKY